MTPSRLFGLVAIGMSSSFCLGVMFELKIAADAQDNMQNARSAARVWEGIAMQWKSNSDQFEVIAHEFQRQALQKADDFAVCNSMLPVEKRM